MSIVNIKLIPTLKAYWIKCNKEVALGCRGLAACKGLFRDSSTATIRCFAKNLGVIYAFHAEIVEVIMTIEMLI
jgi:hypothetical protein